jgi:hypothetical protein
MHNDDDSVRAFFECWGCGRDARPYKERAAEYVRERQKLLDGLRPGSPERLTFIAYFPTDYDEACKLRPKVVVPAPTHGGSDAVN